MSSIDDKLKELWVQIHFKENSVPSIHAGQMTDEAIAAIKQVFAEENYIKIAGLKGRALGDDFRIGNDLMTGQEWYDRLMKEFLKTNHIYTAPDQEDWVAKFTDFVEAARKAAGIQNV